MKKKAILDIKTEIESVKKTQTEGKLEMKNLVTQTRISEANFTNIDRR